MWITIQHNESTRLIIDYSFVQQKSLCKPTFCHRRSSRRSRFPSSILSNYSGLRVWPGLGRRPARAAAAAAVPASAAVPQDRGRRSPRRRGRCAGKRRASADSRGARRRRPRWPWRGGYSPDRRLPCTVVARPSPPAPARSGADDRLARDCGHGAGARRVPKHTTARAVACVSPSCSVTHDPPHYAHDYPHHLGLHL